MKKKDANSFVLFIAFISYLGLLLLLTLFTHNYYTYGRSSNLLLFSSIRLMLRSGSGLLIAKNVVGNVLLFVPLGVLFPLLKKNDFFVGTLLLGLGFSLFIEMCQYYFAARIFDIDDLLLNFAGTLIGRLFVTAGRFVTRKMLFFYSGPR
ncbi:VanZ family protein [Sporolactobacillus spathodeae]|uniref:Glycopeptide antibiotics resistance protein n=2 Tax=Sporolactobacillus spathodeae TaxID=1465502 RepID=A0ABS2Q6Q4_9BACL|nr:VanZ family protein [Sporolactobacillus spathodeae]MBM7657471.1 glycopeptide antibiotics resistance protein [Sporolactobacillus spathodeae]